MSGFSQDSMRYITTAAGGGIEAPGSPQYFIAYRDNAAWGSGSYYSMDSSGNIELMFTAGGGMGGSGTLNYIPKFTPDGTTLGNSLLFDNGTSVLFGGTTAIASAGFAMTSTSQGFLAPRMTTAQRNAIVAPATGLLIYNTSTSLFCYYDGATWQNIDSQAGGDVSGSGTTNYVPLWTDGPNSVLGNSIISYDANKIGINQVTPSATLHVTQTAEVTGAPTALRVVTGAHTTLVASAECTSVYFDFSAVKQWQTGAISTQREVIVLAPTYSFVAASTISTAATFAITGAPIAGTNATITTPLAFLVSSGESRLIGSGTTSATYVLRTYNSTPLEIFSVRNDGFIGAGNSTNGSLTIGFGAGFLPAIVGNTFIGVNSGPAITTGNNLTAIGYNAMLLNQGGALNTAVGSAALRDNVSGSANTAVGFVALASNTAGSNTAVGYYALASNTSGGQNTAIGTEALQTNNIGTQNVAVGTSAFSLNTQGDGGTAVGFAALSKNTTGDRNTALGYFALSENQTGTDNVALGYQAGFYETGSAKLFIDNVARTNEADGRVKALVYGGFASTTAAQWFTHNSNVGILTSTFGTNADGVLGIKNATAPSTSPADMIQIYSVDISAGNASLGLRTEAAVVTETVVSDRTLSVTINGTVYKICLKV